MYEKRQMYSLAEIDDMRMSVRELYGRHGFTREVQLEIERAVEDRLRTYMMNGIDPKELADAVRRRYAASASS